MRKTSSPAAVCWRGSSVRWPRHPPRGRCWGMCCGALGWAVCWRACGMPCALHWGRARCAAFPGYSGLCRSGGAGLRLRCRGQCGRSGPLVYERRAAAGGCMLALDRAARRTPLCNCSRRLPAGTAACGGENRRPAPQKAPCRCPQPPQRAQKGKKVRKKAKIR